MQVDVMTLVVTTTITGIVGWIVKMLTAKMDAYMAESARWRESVDKRMKEQDECIESVLEAQCTQMRSDITHKVHRYMDDLGCASLEEKQSLSAEYEVYCEIGKRHKITNHFVKQLIQQVMALPEREM